MIEGVIQMANKNIRKEEKKKKSTAKPVIASVLKSVVTQPEVIKKPNKEPSQEK